MNEKVEKDKIKKEILEKQEPLEKHDENQETLEQQEEKLEENQETLEKQENIKEQDETQETNIERQEETQSNSQINAIKVLCTVLQNEFQKEYLEICEKLKKCFELASELKLEQESSQIDELKLNLTCMVESIKSENFLMKLTKYSQELEEKLIVLDEFIKTYLNQEYLTDIQLLNKDEPSEIIEIYELLRKIMASLGEEIVELQQFIPKQVQIGIYLIYLNYQHQVENCKKLIQETIPFICSIEQVPPVSVEAPVEEKKEETITETPVGEEKKEELPVKEDHEAFVEKPLEPTAETQTGNHLMLGDRLPCYPEYVAKYVEEQ